VRAIDWLEKKRGFLQPVFVDLRFARSGRAVNFKGNAFSDIVGERRYVWMPKLGNKRIKTKTGKRMQIAEPAAAADLLDLIVALSKKRRRVLMFCACSQPMYCGRPVCHRTLVADLLLTEAKKRRLSLEVAEWPGEKPVSLIVDASESQREAIERGNTDVPLGPVAGRIPSMTVLGWGSSVRFESSDFYCTFITGPAEVRRDQWRLPKWQIATNIGKAAASALSRNFVRKRGAGAHSIR
jgi:hypothetical protein